MPSAISPFPFNFGTLKSTINKIPLINIKVPYKITDRRPGDITSCYADSSYALEKLNWKAEKGIEEMCRDSYNYILNSKNQK